MASKISHTIAGGLLAGTLVVGLTAATAAPATATAPVSAVALRAAAPVYRTVGVFPDPITCAIAGVSTGQAFYCSWIFPFPLWALNVRR